jgi:energy-converting hydrogenase A subunit M
MLNDAITKLLEGSGVPENFIDLLIHESDWSLVIKLHALFEAILANLIVQELRKPSLADVISNLDFNNTKTGKVAFARALRLIDKEEVSFLRGLSELRNMLVHDVKNVSFDLKEYVTHMTEAQRKKFKKEFGAAIMSSENGESKYIQYEQSRPALIVLSAAYSCLFKLNFNLSEQRQKLLVEAIINYKSKST